MVLTMGSSKVYGAYVCVCVFLCGAVGCSGNRGGSSSDRRVPSGPIAATRAASDASLAAAAAALRASFSAGIDGGSIGN